MQNLSQGFVPGYSPSELAAVDKRARYISDILKRAQITRPYLTAAQVEGLLDLYEEAIKYGLPPFEEGAEWFPTLEHVEAFSGLPRGDVVAFLVAMREINGGIPPGDTFLWRLEEAGQAIVQAPAKILETALSPIGGTATATKVLKYGAIIAGSVAAVLIGGKVFYMLKGK